MEKLYKIGDVSKLLNVSIATLRYYEELNLIKPTNVDIYTGYRYYNEENLKRIKQILLLKDLNFSLQEIANLDETSLFSKTRELNRQISELVKKLEIISSLNIKKGEIVMKKFENDERVVGKWEYETSALTKDNYKKGDCYKDKKALYQTLYFLPEGKGYWVFNGWSKGKVYLNQNNVVYDYEIENNKLILTTRYVDTNEVAGCLIYNKVDSKNYTENEIIHNDNCDLPFVLDEKVLGEWQCHDFIEASKLNDYAPSKQSVSRYLTKLNFANDGNVEHTTKYGKTFNRKWTKGHILYVDDLRQSDCNYVIKTIDNEDYLFYQWKTGDYHYFNLTPDYYVFKKIK